MLLYKIVWEPPINSEDTRIEGLFRLIEFKFFLFHIASYWYDYLLLNHVRLNEIARNMSNAFIQNSVGTTISSKSELSCYRAMKLSCFLLSIMAFRANQTCPIAE